MKITRRSVLSWLLGGAFTAFFGDLLWEVGRFLRPPQDLIEGGGGGKRTIIPLAELPAEHSKVVRHEGKLVIVVRHANEIYALSAVCTHLGCLVRWEGGGEPGAKGADILLCPCHDALFELRTGKVLGGPAPRPLQTYPVKRTDDQIVIGEA